MILRKILLSLLFLSYLGYGRNINYPGSDIFPLHDDMVDACRFWIKIYAEYNTNQYVIHDSRNLAVVYEVLKWGDLDESSIDAPFSREQKKYFKEKIKYYKNILADIASVYPDTTNMPAEQIKVFHKLDAFNSRKDILQARKHIRIQRGQKNKFKRGLEISGRYISFLKKIFDKYNLPEELTVLPHVESSFNYKAYSSAGAAGIWQFTRGTGKRYLKISYEIDERLDPVLATEAAAKLLKQNYEALGSWPLAITAYNHGVYGMQRAVRRLKTTNLNTIIKKYHSRYFKFASRNFYCEFVAALHVVQNYQSYFGQVNFEDPIKYKEFQLPQYLKYQTLAKYLDLNDELFHKYNPALRPSVYNNSKYIPRGYRVRLPIYISTDSLLAAIPQSDYRTSQKRSKYYRVRYGDTLSDIARRFGTSVDMLLALNNIANEHFIRYGMTIRLPDQTGTSAPVLATVQKKTVEEPKEQTPDVPFNFAFEDQVIPVMFWQKEEPQEDTTSVIPAMVLNNSSDDMEIEFVQKKNPAVGYIRVEPEETLGHYSDWLQVKTQSVRNWNNFSYRTPIHLNQRIKLVFDKIDPEEFNRLRLEYHRGIEEDFFMNYEITDTLKHLVKNGESLWYLCNEVYNLPYWLIVDYNKNVDIANLKPGDKLTIPAIKSRG